MPAGNVNYAWSYPAEGPRPVPLRNPLARRPVARRVLARNPLAGYFLTACCLLSLGSIATVAQTKPATVTCGTCHSDQASIQADTQMGRAAELPGNNPTLQTHPKLTFKSAGYIYTVETRDGQSRYTVSDGTNSITIPIFWSLG